MHTVGRHLLAELYDCDTRMLDDVEAVKNAICEATQKCGATIVADAFHRFAPHGVSGTVLIAESHLSIHTWPEAGYAAVDLYTCGNLDPRPGFEYLAVVFRAGAHRFAEVIRGLDADIKAAGLPEAIGRHNITALADEQQRR